MTSKNFLKVDECYNGLILQYKKFDFIIDRDYVFASITLEKIHSLESENRFLRNGIFYENGIIPLVEFASYLQESFGVIDENKLGVILIIGISKLTAINQERIAEYISQINCEIIFDGYIALRAGNAAKVQKIPYNELRLIPKCLKKSQALAGILGVRFLNEPGVLRVGEAASNRVNSRIQYLLDIEKMILNQIFPRDEDVQEKV